MVARNVKITLVVMSVLAIVVVPSYFTIDYFSNSFYVIDERLTAEILINKDYDFKRHSIAGSGSEEDPYVLANYNFDSRKDCGIVVLNTNAYFKITNCSISVNRFGIYVDSIASKTCEISNNNIYIKNKNEGWDYYACIKALDSNYLNITQNICSFLEDSYAPNPEAIRGIITVRCDFSSFVGNYIFHSSRGLVLYWSDNCQIRNNNLTACTSIALHLDGLSTINVFNNNISNNSGYGIYTINAEDISILNNTIINNGFVNVFSAGSDSYVICYNLFVSNQGIQIEFWHSYQGSIIHHNNFMLLGGYYENFSSQAIDYEDLNSWYDTTTLQGNYWSDFDWSPSTPYQIAGNGNNTDPYPLESPVVL
ncbi:MAG: hypothetical protein FK734_04530 [Asgard group archaeon]|nr:hypothetical protein [Asgard group archaeon]